jgi:hypothetical protein
MGLGENLADISWIASQARDDGLRDLRLSPDSSWIASRSLAMTAE